MRISLFTSPAPTLAVAEAMRGAAANPVAEIVTFRLSEGADPKAFVAAASGMTPFLTETGAVISRTLSTDDGGLWTDYITWTSMQAAKDAAKAVMARPEAAPFMALIDPETVELRHAPILFSMTPE